MFPKICTGRKRNQASGSFHQTKATPQNIQVGQRLIPISPVLVSLLIFAVESGEMGGKKTDFILSLNPLVCSISEDIITLQPSDCFHREVLGCLYETHALTGTYCRGYLLTLTHCQTGHQDIWKYSIAWHSIGCDTGRFYPRQIGGMSSLSQTEKVSEVKSCLVTTSQ